MDPFSIKIKMSFGVVKLLVSVFRFLNKNIEISLFSEDRRGISEYVLDRALFEPASRAVSGLSRRHFTDSRFPLGFFTRSSTI